MRGVERQRMVAREGLAESIERAGADIAEHDADRTRGKLEQPLLRMRRLADLRRMVVGGHRGRRPAVVAARHWRMLRARLPRRCSETGSSALPLFIGGASRSEVSRVGNELVSTFSFWWSPF